MPPSVLRFNPGIALPPRAYLDTNLIVNARDRLSSKYRAASTCLAEMLRQGVELNVSALVFDELWWFYFRESYRLATGRTLTAKDYKLDPTIWQGSWPRIKQITGEIRAWGRFNEVPAPTKIVVEAAALMDMNPLAPRDAFHLAIALHHSIPSLVTGDSDFDNVQVPPGKSITIVKF